MDILPFLELQVPALPALALAPIKSYASPVALRRVLKRLVSAYTPPPSPSTSQTSLASSLPSTSQTPLPSNSPPRRPRASTPAPVEVPVPFPTSTSTHVIVDIDAFPSSSSSSFASFTTLPSTSCSSLTATSLAPSFSSTSLSRSTSSKVTTVSVAHKLRQSRTYDTVAVAAVSGLLLLGWMRGGFGDAVATGHLFR